MNARNEVLALISRFKAEANRLNKEYAAWDPRAAEGGAVDPDAQELARVVRALTAVANDMDDVEYAA